MKIVYFSSLFFADCDFPLIREWQHRGHEVYFFIDLPCYALKSTIIDINKQIDANGIFEAISYKEFGIFKEYMSLKHVYVVNRTHKKVFHPQNFKVWIKLSSKIKKIAPDVLVLTSIPDILSCWQYCFKGKIVQIVHDPFPHSGESNMRSKVSRKVAINSIKKFVLLNKSQVDIFCKYWKLDKQQICVNKLGPYECTNLFHDAKKIEESKKTIILFWGRISQYKGIEYLLKAMKQVHEVVPNAKLMIIGKGDFYFDITEYENLDYIIIRNEFVSITELSDLIYKCSIVVCPYTDATQSGVVLTAFALGKPVIASNVGGMKEYIQDNVTGLLVTPRSVNALKDAIIKVVQDHNFLERLNKNICARNFSEDGWKGIANKYIEFFCNR